MKIERNDQGDFFVDPTLLSAKLCLDPRELQRRMKIGLVTSLVEAGTGDDEGRRRITVRCGRTVWRAVIDGGDNVISEELASLR